jgi:hypothetical protein
MMMISSRRNRIRNKVIKKNTYQKCYGRSQRNPKWIKYNIWTPEKKYQKLWKEQHLTEILRSPSQLPQKSPLQSTNPLQNNQFPKKRTLKDRSKQLEAIKASLPKSSSDSSDSSDSSSSNNSPPPLTKAIYKPSPKKSVYQPPQTKSISQPPQPVYKTIDIFTTQPSSLVKAKKLTPDFYSCHFEGYDGHECGERCRGERKRRDSHGNRVFTVKDKIERMQKRKEGEQMSSQGVVSMVNAKGEEVTVGGQLQ